MLRPGFGRITCTDNELTQALAALDSQSARIAANSWPGGAANIDAAGLHAWWVDPPGAGDLADGLGVHVHAGRIYAGQAGATKWPSGTVGRATLRTRITRQHIHGRIRGSTFRLTLAAILADQFGLDSVAAKNIGRTPSVASRRGCLRI